MYEREHHPQEETLRIPMEATLIDERRVPNKLVTRALKAGAITTEVTALGAAGITALDELQRILNEGNMGNGDFFIKIVGIAALWIVGNVMEFEAKSRSLKAKRIEEENRIDIWH